MGLREVWFSVDDFFQERLGALEVVLVVALDSLVVEDLGLIGIRERTLALGGEMSVVSRPEKGLILSVTIPITNTAGPAS